jgi:hypothetical protein
MRKVTILSTRDNGKKEIMTDASNWEALRDVISTEGLTVNNMKAMVRETKATLEHNEAVLPIGEFTLFLTPAQVKSGENN